MTSADSPHEVVAAQQSHGNHHGGPTVSRQSEKHGQLMECPVPCKTTQLMVSSEGVTADSSGEGEC